mgnify:CR=1 FL=1
MYPNTLAAKSPDADLLREMIALAARRLMHMAAATGAGLGEWDPLRLAQRNGLFSPMNAGSIARSRSMVADGLVDRKWP